ncbi:MAG: hypothetical protein WA888_06855 [Burkholderiaceae bacterium]
MESLNQALTKAAGSVPPAARSRPRAVVAGAVGRRGEALLNAVLARGGYDEVSVLAEQPVSMGLKNLTMFTLDDVPPAQDLFLLLSDAGDDMGRSPHGRDAAFVAVDETSALNIAKHAVAAGVQRILLVAPTPVLLQFGTMQRGMISTLERGINALAPTRFVILRPLRQHRSSGLSLLQRITNVYMSIQMLMIPRSLEPVTSEQLAHLAIKVLNAAEAGLVVIPAGDLALKSRPGSSVG